MKTTTIRHIGLCATGILLLWGCGKTETASPARETAIGFTTTVTRAALTRLGEGDSFAVWARERPSGQTSSLILDREPVTCRGGIWSYENIRYWKNGATYDFYALYPDTQQASLENTSDGRTSILNITGFDARQSVDLMTAEHTDLECTFPPQPVTFTFRHLLSQIRIIGKTDPAMGTVSARIVSAKLYGMPARGDCTVPPGEYGGWILEESTTTDAGMPFISTNAEQEATAEGISIFGDDLLLFPQNVGKDFTLEVTYDYTDDKYPQGIRFTRTVSLAQAGLSKWQPGKSYRYTFTLGREYILFDRPTVDKWNEATGGNISIDVNNPQ